MSQYQTKPERVDAAQFDGTNGAELGLREIGIQGHPRWVLDISEEQNVTAIQGDWLVKGPRRGQRRLMIDEYFRARYEPVEVSYE